MQTLPADLTQTADLPEIISWTNEGFGLEWYEMNPEGTRSVVVYRYNAKGKLSWSVCIFVSPGMSYSQLRRLARDERRLAR